MNQANLQVNRIERLHLIDQSINDGYVSYFLLERAKHPIPNDQPSSEILIQTVRVASFIIQYQHHLLFFRIINRLNSVPVPTYRDGLGGD